MEPEKIVNEINSLPPAAQKQVLDFIAFIKTRYRKPVERRTQKASFSKEPFFGMWKDRTDMEDSSDWVRKTRKSEWGAPDA